MIEGPFFGVWNIFFLNYNIEIIIETTIFTTTELKHGLQDLSFNNISVAFFFAI